MTKPCLGKKAIGKDLERQREKRREREMEAQPTRYSGYPLALPQYDQSDILTNYYLTKGAASAEPKKRSEDVYAPDRPLPQDERTGERKPDTDAPHTQLGIKNGKKGN